MPDLLLELFSEEIPARFQRRAAEDLKKAVTDALVEAGLLYESAKAFVTPRRLTLTVTGIPARSPDIREEKKGPRVGAPQQAIDGFLKAAGLTSLDQARIESDPKKGEFYVAISERKGDEAPKLLAGILPRIITGFSWPKSMQWGHGGLSWVRPIRAITATFGTDNDEPQVIDFATNTLRSGQTTYGHRFLAPQPITVRRFEDYVDQHCKPATDNQFAALVSFCFNVGEGNLRTSTLRRMHNAGDYKGAAAQFARWDKAAGKVLPGLVKRRAAERKLYETE